MHLYDGQDRIYDTWKLLWCQGCGRAQLPPVLPPMDLVADQHLECAYCGEKLALLECITSGEHWHERPGAPHRYVATLGSITR